LNANGLLATLSLGSLTYISPAMRNIINTHINTLKSVFPVVTVLPGDFNLYLSSIEQSSANLTAETLYNRLAQRGITTNLFSLGYIQYRTNKRTVDWLQQTLSSDNQTIITSINHDGAPRGLSFSLYYWNTIANPSLQKIFSVINKINLKIIIIISAIILCVLFLFRKKYGYRVYIPFAVFTTGFIAMVFSLVLSLGFQVRYGFLYYQISILITTFIAGSALGGYVGNFYLPDKRKYFFLIELLILFLLFILTITLKNQAYPKIFGSQFDFFIFLFLSGFLVGLEFPLANRIFKESQVTQTVGTLYAADLFGGFFSAVIISVVLIPVIGIFQTIICAIILKIVSACLVLTVTGFSIE
jgi:spermidine synthase